MSNNNNELTTLEDQAAETSTNTNTILIFVTIEIDKEGTKTVQYEICRIFVHHQV